MNTKTILIIGGIAVAGLIAYGMYQRHLRTVAAPQPGAGQMPSTGTGSQGTAAIIDSSAGALDTLADIFG